jgi:dihydroflavonol-4-reductase
MGRVLQAARQARLERLIYTSSLTTLGPPSEPGRLANERDFYRPGSSPSAYYEAKFVMERLALEAAADGLPVVVLLPTAVFGPGDVKPVTGQLMLEVARGRIPLAFEASQNVVDVRDVAASHVAVVERGRVGERYVLGGHNLSLRAALAIAAQAAGVPPPRLSLPRSWVEKLARWLALLPGLALPDHARALHLWQPVSSLKAGRELGHTARPFSETARDTLAWFRQWGYL